MQVLGGVKTQQSEKFKKLQRAIKSQLKDQSDGNTVGNETDESTDSSDEEIEKLKASIREFDKGSKGDVSTKSNTVE